MATGYNLAFQNSPETLVYLVLLITLAVGTVYYIKNFNVWRVIKSEGIKCINSRTKFFHVLVAGFLVISNINVWLKFSNSYLSALPVKNLHLEGLSPVTRSLLWEKFNDFEFPAYSFIEEGVNQESIENLQCDNIKFTDIMKSSSLYSIAGDLKRVRNQALELSKSEYPIAKNCFMDKKEESEDDILREKWDKFCGSSVWLSKYEVHFFVNRVVYAHEKERSKPTISLIDIQIFDREWKELRDFKISLSNGEVLKFPGLLKIDIDQNPKGKFSVMGPEDPRVVLRTFVNESGEKDEEPVIIFNMRRTDIRWRRAMHFYRPFNGNNTIRLSLRDRAPRFREKNWAPFFDSMDSENIYFVYNFNPLRIVKCGLENGVCDKIFGPDFIDTNADESEHVGALRGGTNLVPIPSELLPGHLKFRDYWFGIARSHNGACGCLNEIYRPHFFIISKDSETGRFIMDYVSGLLDFNIHPEPWNEMLSICEDGKSVLIPNSIGYWDFILSDHKKVEEDFMVVTFSEADRTNKRIHIKGFWNHMLRALNSQGRNYESVMQYYMGDNTEFVNGLLSNCSTSLAKKYCKTTAKSQNWFQNKAQI